MCQFTAATWACDGVVVHYHIQYEDIAGNPGEWNEAKIKLDNVLPMLTRVNIVSSNTNRLLVRPNKFVARCFA